MFRSFQTLLFFAAVCLLSACTKSSSTPLTLYIGVHEDATGFADWEDALYYKINATRKVNYPQGARVEASFGHKYGEEAVKLDLILKDPDGEMYTVDGTYDATDPFTLTFLGTNENGQKENQLSFRAGSGKISFKGKLLYTYENKKTDNGPILTPQKTP